MNFSSDRAYAQSRDRLDPLASYRDRFHFADPELIYLDGNSLGRLPLDTMPHLEDMVRQQWGERLIRGWNEGWIELQERLGARLAELLGAAEDEIIIADSTSINLFKLALAALKANEGRSKIVTDDLNFPSDLYILQGAAQLAGRPLTIDLIPSADGIHGPVEQLLDAVDGDTALVSLSHTTFKSSYTYDMTAVTAHAAAQGAFMLWDTSHSAGSVPVDFHAAGAGLAVGCTYKYLNGGPGAPAFLYVRRDLQPLLHNPLTGWMGQRNMFEFGLTYERDPGLRHFLTGTPPILSIAALEPGLALLQEVGMGRLRRKSAAQTDYLIQLWAEWLAPLGFRLNSPRDGARRGSHVSLGHDDGYRIAQALIRQKVIPDFRRPDNIRFGIAPLYNSFSEIHEAMSRLRRIVVEELYREIPDDPDTVT